MGLSVVRPDPQGVLKVHRRFSVTSVHSQCSTESIASLGRFGFKRFPSITYFNRLGGLARHQEDFGKVPHGTLIIWLHCEGLTIPFDGRLVLALLRQQEALVVQPNSVVLQLGDDVGAAVLVGLSFALALASMIAAERWLRPGRE